MKFKIEELKVKDFDKFHPFAKDLVLNQFLDYPPRVRKLYLRRELDPKDLKKALRKGEKKILLALSGEKIIGFLVLRFDSHGGGSQIAWVGVDEKFRRQGVGSNLVKAAEDLSLSHKCHFVYLWTESKRNIEFYKKRGYYLVGLQKEQWYGIDEYLMQKNLRKPFKEIFKLS